MFAREVCAILAGAHCSLLQFTFLTHNPKMRGNMGDIFRNRFFVIFLIVGCILTVATMGLNIAGYGNLVSGAAGTIISPFQMFASLLNDSISGITDYFTRFNELRDENAELWERVRELEAEREEIREIMAENDMLRQFFELRRERPDFSMQDASVIVGSAGNYITGFMINRGTFHGIERDMPVITACGVVGFVSHVELRRARVAPFIRASSSVGAYIRRTGQTGVVMGEFELARQSLARLVDLARGADIQEGDRVYSSGYGLIYPDGLFIGTVAAVYNDPLTQTPAAYIRPGVDFNNLRDVMVILEANWVFD